MQRIDPQELRELTRRIIASGELGRSRTYAAILEYLVECSIAGETPKEAAIAVDVLGRESDFDVARDSIVRVHIYHLRNKLDSYFAKYGEREKFQIEIPKGQYMIGLRDETGPAGAEEEPPAAEPAGTAARRNGWMPWLTGLAALLLLLNLLYLLSRPADETAPFAAVVSQGPWRAIFDDQAPILLVVGDYFIFGELDEAGNVERMVREFDINSAEDLDTLFMLDPELADRYYNLGLTYIPNGVAEAMMELMPVLYDQGRRISLKLASEINASDLTSNHVIYLGYISGLDILQDLVFNSSGLTVGSTFDELRVRDGSRSFVSDSGILNTGGEYRDYALVSTFPSPRGYRFLVVAGMRDAGLINAAQQISEAGSLGAIVDEVEAAGLEPPGAWEALFEVYGFDHTNFDAGMVYSGPLDPQRIWSGRGGF